MTQNNTSFNKNPEPGAPKNDAIDKTARGTLQVLSGLIPGIGGFFAAASGAWSEHTQDKANNFFKYWIDMLRDQFNEQAHTIMEIMARLDLQDSKVEQRIQTSEFQSLVKKAFRDWSAAEDENKRQYIRNILANAASCDTSSDDVVRLFLDWLQKYSGLHFHVIGAIYNSNGISRGAIWNKMGKGQVREDSADADLYKLVIHDLSLGHIIRQHRQTDYNGNMYTKTQKKRTSSKGPKQMKSAFDTEELYELTSLGQQFVHYAMTDLPLKIEYKKQSDS